MAQDTADKRQEIKDRIAAAQERQAVRDESLAAMLAEKAAAARDGVTQFAKDHPVATVAGGLALGVLISAMFKNSPTRRAGRYAGARAAGLATLGTEIASSLLQQVVEGTANARRAGAESLEDAGDAISETARKVGHSASEGIGNGADLARSAAREIGRSIARSFQRH